MNKVDYGLSGTESHLSHMRAKRHSAQRQQIMRLIKLSPRALTVAEMRRQLGRAVSKSALYRNLNYLVTSGEIYELENAKGVTDYFGHTWHEARFICQHCGAIRRLNSRTLPDYVQRKMPGMQTVFVSRLEGRGLCKQCATKLKSYA